MVYKIVVIRRKRERERERERERAREREVHNTNFRILRHFLTIFPGKSVRPIFMKFSGFVYHVKD